MNLFLSLLTGPAPSANYRGESDHNRAVIQKLVIGQDQYPVISPEAIRNGLREMLRTYGLDCNRQRERNAEQPTVSFADYPDPKRFVDDFLFGYMVVNREQIPKAKRAKFVYKRDSILRNNLAIGLTPYLHETLFTQAPNVVHRDNPEKAPAWSNADSSQLLHREMTFTAYQLPMALNLDDCQLESETHRLWLAYFLQALSELTFVGGNLTRSYFEMAPVSAIARVTPRLASGYPLYPFQCDGTAASVIQPILRGDKPGHGLHFAGELLDTLSQEQSAALTDKGVQLHRTPEGLLNNLSMTHCGRPMPALETAP